MTLKLPEIPELPTEKEMSADIIAEIQPKSLVSLQAALSGAVYLRDLYGKHYYDLCTRQQKAIEWLTKFMKCESRVFCTELTPCQTCAITIMTQKILNGDEK